MVGWHHRLDRHEFERALGDGEGQGGLACCRPWGRKVGRSSVTEQRQQVPLSLRTGGAWWSSAVFGACTLWLFEVSCVPAGPSGAPRGAEPVGGAAPWVSRAPSPERTPWPWAAFRQPLLELSMPFPPRLCPWRKFVVIFLSCHNEIDWTSFYPFKIC